MARPTLMTPETISKLEEAFAFGCNDLEACHFAGISKTTLYNYQEKHPKFVERKEALKDNPVLLAKKNVLDAVLDGDKSMSTWLLERKRKDEYSTKQNHDHTTAGEPVNKVEISFVSPKVTDTGEV